MLERFLFYVVELIEINSIYDKNIIMDILTGYTVYTSYVLVPDFSAIGRQTPTPQYLGRGYSNYIHCNYINKLVLDTTDPYVQEIIMNFPKKSDFKFLSPNVSSGTGFTAQKIYALIQLVDNTDFANEKSIKPSSSAWKIFDLTKQIKAHVSGNTLTANELTAQVFKIPLKDYENPNIFSIYRLLDFIKYPSREVSADNELCFGDEYMFLGNVRTEIKAVAYTTDLSIRLELNEFNSSTNSSWTAEDRIAITEIGIYDENKNLVAIGKLNNPIIKDSTISRTIAFQIDF